MANLVSLDDSRWNTLLSDLMALTSKLESLGFRLVDGIVVAE